MANEVLVGLRIGAAVSGTLSAAFGSAKSVVQQLGRATDGLKIKQKQIGSELAASIARGGTGVERLRRQYDQVGRAIDQLKSKQERLNTSIARGETLKNERSELRGEAMETVATAAVVGAPVAKAVDIAIDFQDLVRDIAITGEFDEAKEKGLSDVMRGAALRWNQTQMEVATGVNVLIAGNISDLEELKSYAPVMAKSATATRASMDDLGAVAISLNDILGITAAGFERSMNMLAFAGKSGQFELADMAKWLPQLTPQFKALGITGERAVSEIGASLQIARKGAGSNDEAANNFKNFLNKLTAPDTLKSFNDAGVDLEDAMKNLVSQGLSPAEAMIRIITKYLGSDAPAAASKYRKALDIKDEQERQTALTRLDEAYKLSSLFADQQVLAYVRPALANQSEAARIQQGSKDAADKGGLDADWNMRMGSAKEQLKVLTVGLSDLGIAVGSILLPTIVDLTQKIVPVVQAFSNWAENNSELISGTLKLLAGAVALKLGLIGIRYGMNLGATALNGFGTFLSLATGKLALFNWTLISTQMAPFIAGVKHLVSVIPGLSYVTGVFGSVLAATPIGWIIAAFAAIAIAGLLIYKYWEPISAFFSGFFTGFVEGLKPIRDAFSAAFEPIAPLFSALGQMIKPVIRWFSELFTPVHLTGDELGRATMSGIEFGRAVGAVVAALFTPIRWLLEFIGEIPKAFEGGIAGMAKLILDFSPLDLFYRAFSGVMSYFGVELPAKFSDFGGMIISGLVSGIGNALNTAKESIVGVGTSIKTWFAETLGIQSPSRVFIGYGSNISEGAAIGITAQAGLVRKAALDMAGTTAVELAAPKGRSYSLPQPPSAEAVSVASRIGTSAGGGPGVGGDLVVHYSPKIELPAGAQRQQVEQVLRGGYDEFVRFMERFQHDQRRRSYGPDTGGRA
ncbi:phage tail tape measure protein [Pseudomonas rubra]|uniref:Phage tail tape measure protein n=1 Tax=Pseudomonas rubra TaxID=2942627 RepID=A0ABT5PFQ8_9PSED|nr:phage tail tape measure protein [Pseudomonas rubra]MDD1016833.1 phage tail tape measure protein [Pseudomonas rubra]MDD1041472.1 phage tail tape measure protein [Pseudomonas rubra]MDD1154977.1 phage tail tape measure protein [Pseudomonas rubra]